MRVKIIELFKKLIGKEHEAMLEAEELKEIYIKTLPPIFEALTAWQEIKQAVEKTIDKIRELNDKSMSELEKKTQNIQTIIAEGINGGIKKTSQAMAETIVLGKNLADTFRKMVQEVLVKMVAHFLEMSVRMSWDLLLQQIKTKELRKQTAELEKQKRIKGVSALMSGNPLGALGFMASGGAVSKAQPTIVGERGPELFVPNSSGQITQSARGVGGGSTNVNFTINAIDTRGFEEALIQNRGIISNIINKAVNERGAKSII